MTHYTVEVIIHEVTEASQECSPPYRSDRGKLTVTPRVVRVVTSDDSKDMALRKARALLDVELVTLNGS